MALAFKLVSVSCLIIDFYLLFFFLQDIDDCVNHTCANGGSCVDGINSYSCNCHLGYTGDHCKTGKLLEQKSMFQIFYNKLKFTKYFIYSQMSPCHMATIL